MSKKRLIVSFAAVVVLLAIAGVIELALLMFPASGDSDFQRSSETVAGQPAESAAAQPAESKAAEPITAEGDGRSEGELPTEIDIRAAELTQAEAIIYNGSPLMRGPAKALVESAASFTDSVEHIDQLTVLSSGCEIVSLAAALKAEGFDASPTEIADKHLRIGDDFTVDYIGSPRENGGGFPVCIVDAGNSWLDAHDAPARAVNLTGTTFEGVERLVELGYPVITWTTEQMVEPVASGDEENGLQWYNSEHCVVVYGVNGDEVLVADPLEGLVRRDRAKFAQVYEGCGNLAVFVQP